MKGITDRRRVALQWEDVESRYWGDISFEEAKGFLHATVQFAVDSQAIVEFLMRVGEERDPQEQDERLRQEARKLLARYLLKWAQGTANKRLLVLITHFFADYPAHSALPKQELEHVQMFLRYEYEYWYSEWATRGYYHPTLPDYGKVVIRALVNARAYEYLRAKCLTGAIPYLYEQLYQWLRNENGDGIVLGFQDHPELLTTWEARTFPCRPSLMVEALGKKKDIEFERKFFQMLTSVNALCGAVFTHYGVSFHETHRECAMTLLALIAMSSMQHDGA